MTAMPRIPGHLATAAMDLAKEVPVDLTDLRRAAEQWLERRRDRLAASTLPRFEDGNWRQSHGQALVEEFPSIWDYFKFNWRQWRCIRQGWLEYERGTVPEYGWSRITPKGRARLVEARVYGGIRGRR